MRFLSRMHSTGEAPCSVNMPYVLFLGVTASLGGMLFGFDLGIIAGAGPFLHLQFHLSDLELGLVYSALLFGCVAGSLAAGRIMETYGRRRLLIWVALLFLATSLMTGLAPGFAWIVSARFVGGLAVGAVSVASPVYIAEVSPPRIRGRMGAAYQMAITTGILIAYILDYGLRNTGPWNWRWMFMSGALPSIAFFLALLVAPETPRYLFKAGRTGEGESLLLRIMGPKEAMKEKAAIGASLLADAVAPQGLPKTYRRALLFSIGLALLVQISGINTVIDYAPVVLDSTGWKIDAALSSTFVIGAVNFLSTLVSFWTIDRFGRRPLYLAGSAGMAIAMTFATVALAARHGNGALLLASMVLFIAFFASCIGPVFWTVLPEIFPNRDRARCMVVPVVTQWMANAGIILLFPLAFHRLGRAPTFAFFACMSGLQAFFIFRYLPETKGRALEEIEALWRQNPNPRAPAKELGV